MFSPSSSDAVVLLPLLKLSIFFVSLPTKSKSWSFCLYCDCCCNASLPNDSAAVVGSNVGLSEWEGPAVSPCSWISMRPWFSWTSYVSDRTNGETDRSGKVAASVDAERCLV